MATSLPPFPSFPVREDELSVGIRWKKWLNKFEILLTAMDITKDARKKALMLHYAGDEVVDLCETLLSDDGAGDYKTLKSSLTEYFSQNVNQTYEAFKFRKLRQEERESIEQYHVRLSAQASRCNFHDNEREILSQMIEGMRSSNMRRKALRENMPLKRLVFETRNDELTKRQAEELESAESANTIRTPKQKVYEYNKNSPRSDYSHFKRNQEEKRKGTTCRNCGGPFPHKSFCPARGKTCHKCQKQNHFASVCKSVTHRNTVKHVSEKLDNLSITDQTSSSEEDLFHVNSRSNKIPTANLRIGKSHIKFCIDTGASVNVMTDGTYRSLSPKPALHQSSKKIFGYGSQGNLDMIGCFEAIVSHKKEKTSSIFYVIKTSNSPNLLSAKTSEELNLVHFLNKVTISDDLFSGSGKLDKVSVKLHIDDSIQPIAQTNRRVPFHIRKDIEKELAELEKNDIIEDIDGPTPWVSPIVAVPKKTGGVRLCVDMRNANMAIKRERHPIPTIDEIINELNGSTVFSRIDLKQAFHQLELDKESRFITTFSTHVGLKRYKRLMFGINAAPEIFQKVMSDLLHDIPGVTNFMDDIIVHGPTMESHDKNLQATLDRLLERGARLNKEKCIFGVNKLTFLGHVFGNKGIYPHEEKVEAIQNTKQPTSVSEIKSFLGMTQFLARFIGGYSSITEPLRILTKKNQPWIWGKEQDKAFNKLKNKLTNAETMAYFDPQKDTEIIVDAAPCGLGAMLTQQGRIVCYASRSLTDVESRYSQTEREMLAVVFGIERFHIYLFGSTFTVITDHKPLLGIIKSNRSCTPRIERWRLRLMPYEFTLMYKPGKNEQNPADYLSRFSFNKPRKNNVGEEYVNYVTKSSVPNALSLDEIKQATKMDKTLIDVMNAIQSNNWRSQNLVSFEKMRHELSIYDGIVLRQNRIVIPETLQRRVVALAHVSHQGIVKTKQLLREKVWFAGIDNLVEQEVKNCLPCQAAYVGTKPREPLSMTPLPSSPWDELSADFMGPFPTGEYLLVVIDDFSRFPEVEIIHSTSSKTTCQKLNQIFSRFGVPSVLKTDNGPPFNGAEFASFARNVGFHHRKITPLWPEANGEAERS